MIPLSPINLSLREMIACLSAVASSQNSEVSIHQARVAFIAARLGVIMGLEGEELETLFIAALVHDLGLVTPKSDSQSVIDLEAENSHGVVGAHYLREIPVLSAPADLVTYHHMPFYRVEMMKARGLSLPGHASILQAADVIVGWIKFAFPMLHQIGSIVRKVREAGDKGLISPSVAAAFCVLAQANSFWLELLHATPESLLEDIVMPDAQIPVDDVYNLASLFATMVDTRSRFTATHTAGVAASAEALGLRMGWPQEAARQLKIAGLLHDLGKLVLPPSILNKSGGLDETERTIVQAHSFYTLKFLESAPSLLHVARWGADHHERLDGSGYPFGKGAEDLPMGSRIIAVADVFTALAEDRPYRLGMDRAEIQKYLEKFSRQGHFDPSVVETLLAHYEGVNEARLRGQLRQTMSIRDHWARVEEGLRTEATLMADRSGSAPIAESGVPVSATVSKVEPTVSY